MLKRASVGSVAEAYLELLAARGVEYFFANAGTDFAPIVEAYARRAAQGQALPRPITVPHETTAVALAHGYAMVTGRPQVVMVHVIVGTANALGGIMNAARANVPMLVTAGRTPITEAGMPGSRNLHIHWAQEAFDQGAIVREFVKWDYELRLGAQLETVVDRALAIARSEPAGPVYLTLPREVLAERLDEFEYSAPPRSSPATRFAASRWTWRSRGYHASRSRRSPRRCGRRPTRDPWPPAASAGRPSTSGCARRGRRTPGRSGRRGRSTWRGSHAVSATSRTSGRSWSTNTTSIRPRSVGGPPAATASASRTPRSFPRPSGGPSGRCRTRSARRS